jgi:hypothetical protein
MQRVQCGRLRLGCEQSAVGLGEGIELRFGSKQPFPLGMVQGHWEAAEAVHADCAIGASAIGLLGRDFEGQAIGLRGLRGLLSKRLVLFLKLRDHGEHFVLGHWLVHGVVPFGVRATTPCRRHDPNMRLWRADCNSRNVSSLQQFVIAAAAQHGTPVAFVRPRSRARTLHAGVPRAHIAPRVHAHPCPCAYLRQTSA